jgi:hypothetical protein
MVAIPYLCIGLHGFLMAALMLRMSLFRMARTQGEGNPKSYFEQVHKVQLLTAEWSPMLALLTYVLHANAVSSGVALNPVALGAIIAATAGRYLFAARVILPVLGFPGATLSYVGFFLLSFFTASLAF